MLLLNHEVKISPEKGSRPIIIFDEVYSLETLFFVVTFCTILLHCCLNTMSDRVYSQWHNQCSGSSKLICRQSYLSLPGFVMGLSHFISLHFNWLSRCKVITISRVCLSFVTLPRQQKRKCITKTSNLCRKKLYHKNAT